jgi:hypothetical protein
MHELGAQLNRQRGEWVAVRQDTAADPIARFKNGQPQASLFELHRGR